MHLPHLQPPPLLPPATWILRRIAPRQLVNLGCAGHTPCFALRQAIRDHGLATLYHRVDGPPGQAFADASVDMVQLDARCDAAWLKAQWQAWLPKLAPRAWVICLNSEDDAGFWAWLRAEHAGRANSRQCQWLLQIGHGGGELTDADWDLLRQGMASMPERPAEQGLRAQVQALLKALAESDLALAARDKERLAHQHELWLRDQQSQAIADNLHTEIKRLVQEHGQLVREHGLDTERLNGLRLAALEAQREAYETSSSWRLTAPLRFVVELLKQRRETSPVHALPNTTPIDPGSTPAAAPAAQEPAVPESTATEPDPTDYSAWLAQFDALDAADLKQANERLRQWAASTVRISFVIDLEGANETALAQTLASLRQQVHSEWELLLIGTDDSVAADLGTGVHQVKTREADATGRRNQALQQASGTWVVFLQPGDGLHPFALYWLLERSIQVPTARLIYGDEDHLDDQGRRCRPAFKCDFNYELLLACDLMGRASAYQRSLLSELGGLRHGLGSATLYDLNLRAAETLATEQIQHLPRLIRHAAHGDQPDTAAAQRAVAEHLQRRGVQASVLPAPEAPGLLRVRLALPERPPRVSIVIPTRDQVGLLSVCVDSLLALTDYPDYELLIIDNGSVRPETLLFFEGLTDQRVRVLCDDSAFNFSALINLGARESRGDLLCLLNNDIQVTSAGWLSEMVAFALQPGVGAVGARLWYANDRLQHAGITLGVQGVAGHAFKGLARGEPGYLNRAVLHQSVSAVTAACLVVRRQVFEQVEGFDTSLGVAYNDVDFCLRVRAAGYRNVWTPYAELVHHESISRGFEDNPEKRKRFEHESGIMKARWGQVLLEDPAYNPNLTLEREDFSLAWPPRIR